MHGETFEQLEDEIAHDHEHGNPQNNGFDYRVGADFAEDAEEGRQGSQTTEQDVDGNGVVGINVGQDAAYRSHGEEQQRVFRLGQPRVQATYRQDAAEGSGHRQMGFEVRHTGKVLRVWVEAALRAISATQVHRGGIVYRAVSGVQTTPCLGEYR